MPGDTPSRTLRKQHKITFTPVPSFRSSSQIFTSRSTFTPFVVAHLSLHTAASTAATRAAMSDLISEDWWKNEDISESDRLSAIEAASKEALLRKDRVRRLLLLAKPAIEPRASQPLRRAGHTATSACASLRERSAAPARARSRPPSCCSLPPPPRPQHAGASRRALSPRSGRRLAASGKFLPVSCTPTPRARSRTRDGGGPRARSVIRACSRRSSASSA